MALAKRCVAAELGVRIAVDDESEAVLALSYFTFGSKVLES